MRIAAIFTLLFAYSAAAYGQDSDAGCAGPDTSTSYEACVLSKETKIKRQKLSQKFDVLLKFSESNENGAKDSLLESQKAWERYLQQTCEAQQLVFGGIVSINYVRCENTLVKERLAYLESLP